MLEIAELIAEIAVVQSTRIKTLTCHYGLIEPPNVPNGSDERERDLEQSLLMNCMNLNTL